MKRKFLAIFFIFFLNLVIVGCNGIAKTDGMPTDSLTDETNSSNEQTSIQQHNSASETEKTIEREQHYLVTNNGEYIYSSYQGEFISSDNTVLIVKDISDVHLVNSSSKKGSVDQEKAGKSIKIQIGSDFIYPIYYMSFSPVEDANNLNNKFNNYDVYLDHSGNRYHVLSENGNLIKFVNKNDDKESDLLIDESEAVLVANTFVKDVLGEELFNKYSINEEVSVMFNQYWISYMRLFYGYQTVDEIIVCVDFNGNISSYTGSFVSLFDNIRKNDVTEEDIVSVEESLAGVLFSLGLDNFQVVSSEVFINEDGELFLGLYVLYGNDSNFSSIFYVEIS